jgi:hypothetical protein
MEALVTLLRNKVVNPDFIKFLDTIRKGSKTLILEWNYPEIIAKFKYHPDALEKRLRLLMPNETDVVHFQHQLDECLGFDKMTHFIRSASFVWVQGKMERSNSERCFEPGFEGIKETGKVLGEIRYVGGED